MKLLCLVCQLTAPQDLEETEHFRHWRQEEVAKIIHGGDGQKSGLAGEFLLLLNFSKEAGFRPIITSCRAVIFDPILPNLESGLLTIKRCPGFIRKPTQNIAITGKFLTRNWESEQSQIASSNVPELGVNVSENSRTKVVRFGVRF